MSLFLVAGVGSLGPSLLPVSTPLTLSPTTSAEVEGVVKVEGALANEVGLIILAQLENFGAHFKVGYDHALERKCLVLIIIFPIPVERADARGRRQYFNGQGDIMNSNSYV